MLHSLFILNSKKHFRGLVVRSVCDYFWDQVCKSSTNEVQPVLSTSKYVLIHVQRDGLYFLAVSGAEVAPLLVIEFLHRIGDILNQYFERINESVIRENFVTVYQVLDEMMDNGFPFTTEPNALMEMIPPPSIMKKFVGGITGQSSVSATLPDGSLSNTPWRKSGVRYTTNEIYFDIVEEMDCTIEPNGMVVSCEVSGEIQALSKLSGMPDLTLSFTNPHILDDVSFHPCVRYNRYEQSRVISFVPPDGQFTLMNYRVKGQLQIPIYVKPQISFGQGSGKVSIMVGQKTQGKAVEDVKIIIQFPKVVSSAGLSANIGSVQYDDITKSCKWTIGKIPKEKTPFLEGTVQLVSGVQAVDANPSIQADFRISMYAASGLKVDTLAITNERYKPYKGVRSVTKAGKFYIRS